VALIIACGGLFLVSCRTDEVPSQSPNRGARRGAAEGRTVPAVVAARKEPALPATIGGKDTVTAKSTEGSTSARPVYLCDLNAAARFVVYDKQEPPRVNGRPSPHCFWLHPPHNGVSFITFNLGKKYQRFQAAVGINDGANLGAGPNTALVFSVLGDRTVLWKSKPTKRCGEPQDCDISILGVDVLQLRVECPGENFFAHAVWLEPRVQD
jgi:hypothetical protein